MEWTKINEDGEVEFVSEEVKLVPEVQAILTLAYNKGPNDFDGRKRTRAKNEVKFLRLNYSSLSPYRDYSKEERREQTLIDCGFPANWTESEELKILTPKFIKGHNSKVARLLSKVENFLEKFEKHLDDIDLNERNQSGGMVHDPAKIMTTLRGLPAMAQTIQQLEQQVKLGMIGTPKSKGDHEVGWIMNQDPVVKKEFEEDEQEEDI